MTSMVACIGLHDASGVVPSLGMARQPSGPDIQAFGLTLAEGSNLGRL